MSGAGVYSLHGCGVGLCTLFLLPGSQHLAGQCYRHTSEQQCRQNLGFTHLLFLSVVFRKLQLSPVNTTENASCFPSLTTMMCGTSYPPLPCLDPSWYAQDSNIQHFARGSLARL